MRVSGACNRPDSRQNDKKAQKRKNGGLGGGVEVSERRHLTSREVERLIEATKGWSISVYNDKGYFEPNPQNAYTLNNLTAKTDADGSNRFVAPSLGRKRPIGRCTAWFTALSSCVTRLSPLPCGSSLSTVRSLLTSPWVLSAANFAGSASLVV